jgi:cytochrome c-type biogenesis protein CcmH/NrfF
MSSAAPRTSNWGSLGLWSIVFGVVALVGVTMIAQASFGTFGGFDPPGWLRITTAWMLPVGAIAAVAFGVLSVSRRSARPVGMVGIALAAASVAIFVAMLATHPY